MKTKLFALVACGAALTGCAASDANPFSAATFSQDASSQSPAYNVQADAAGVSDPFYPPTPKAKPFFKKVELKAELQDVNASLDTLDGHAHSGMSSKIKINVKGNEKLSKSYTFITEGKLEFRDLTRNLRLRGKVDDNSVFMSEYYLFANVQGHLDNGDCFSLDIGEVNPYEVAFTFKLLKPDAAEPYQQYSGTAERGKLRVRRQ